MGLEDAREDNLDMAAREEAVAVVPPGEVEVKKMENYYDFLVHGARKNSGFATDVVAGDNDMAQSQVAVAGSVDSTAEAPVSVGTADVDTVPASSSDVVESAEKVESKDLSEAVEESAGNNEDSKPNFAEDGAREYLKTQANSDLIADAPISAAPVQDAAGEAAMSGPSADVEEKAVEVRSEDPEVVSEESSAEVAGREEVSSKILDEGSGEKRDSEASAVPVEEVQLVAQDTTPVNRNEAIATPEAASLCSADVQERCAELDFKDARALDDDVSPQIEDSGSAKKDDSEALTDRVEEYQEIRGAATSANPDEDASSLEASIPPSVGIGEESVELGSKDVGAVIEGVSPSIVDEDLTEKGDSESPSAPLEVVEEVEDASTRTEPDEHLASLNAVPSPSVDVGVKSIDLESNDSRAPNEDISPLLDEGGSAEIGESEAPEAAVVEVHGLAEATTSAPLDDDVAGLEAAHSPSTDVGETSVKPDSEDVGAVSDDVSTAVQDEESADKGENDAPVANISAEPDEAVGNLDAEPPPSVPVGVKSAELDSEGTRALNADVGPRIDEEVSAEKGDSDAAEAPLEEVHDVAVATSSVEADPDAAGLKAAPSPSVDVGEKSVELNSEGPGAAAEYASLTSEGEGSAMKGKSTEIEAPAKEVDESAGVATSVKPEEEVADLDAPPSRSDGLTSIEADAEDAGTLNESGSPKIEDEGSAAEKGESEAPVFAEEVNEVAEPASIAEPLEAASSPFTNVEEKSLEPDPEVSLAVSEDVSPEIEDEGSAEKGGLEAPEAPIEEVHEVAEAATSAEPLEAAPSPLVDVEEKPFELGSEVARALSVDASPEIEDEGSAAEKGESKAAAPPDEVNEVAEPTSVAEPLEAAPSHFANVEEKPFELDPEGAGAETEDASLTSEGEGSAMKGKSTEIEAPAKEVDESAGVATSVKPEEEAADLDAPPSRSDGLTSVEADAEDAGTLNESGSPKIEDEGSAAEKGESEAPVFAEEVNEVAEPTSMAEPPEAASSPFANVGEKSLEPDPEVSRAVSEDARPEIEDEGSAEKGGSEAPEAPVEEVHEVAESATSAEPLEAAPSPLVDVEEKPFELGSQVARALSVDASPEIEDEGLAAEKGESEATAPPEEVNEVAEPISIAEPLEAAPSPLVDVGDKSFELNSEGVRAASKDASLKSEDEGLSKKGDSTGVEAPAKEVDESAGVATSVEPEEDAADLDAPPSHSDGLTSVEADAEDAGTLNENISPKIDDEGSATEKGESEDIAPPQEVNEVAEPKSTAEPLEAAPLPSANVEEKSFELDPDVARAASEDVSPEIEDEGSAEKGGSEAPEAPVEEVHEVAEAATSAEPLEASPSPFVDVEEKPPELGSEVARALSVDASPNIEAEGSAAEKGESEASAPPEEVNEDAELTNIAEPLKAASLPSVDVGDSSVELNSEGAGAESKDANPKGEGEGSAKTGDSTGTEAPAKEVNESAGVPPSVEPEEDAASLNAPPSHSDGLASVEADAEDAGTLNESGGPKIEDEGSAAEKGESEAPVLAEEVNEVAESKSTTEPLEAASSPFANVKEKSFEPDPEFSLAVSEGASPEIEDEGLAAEKGESEALAPVEQMNEVAEADPDVESDEARASLETAPSPSAEVEEKIVDVDEKSVDTDNKPVAVESKPADVTDRSGSTEDLAFPKEDLHAEDPANVEESPETLDQGSAEQGECEVHGAPVEEGHEVAEAEIDAEPDAPVASLEATPSPSVHAGGTSAQPESEDAVAVGDDVNLQFEDGESGSNSESEAPEARVEEVQEVAEATAGAEPAEDAYRLDSAVSPSLDARERGIELDSEYLRAAASVDVSQNLEDAGFAGEGNSAAPEASVEEVRELPDVTTSAEHNEVEASLDAEPSPSVNAGERDIELDSEEAGALNEDISPTNEDCGSAEKGDSEARETPLEEVHEVAAATSTVEADPDAASDVGVVRGGSFAEVPASEEASPNFPGKESAEIAGLESPRALVEEVQKVAEAATPVEGNETETNLDTVLPRSADVEETSVEVDSEDARIVSDDVSPEIEDERWAEKGDSAAHESPIEVDQEVAEATTIPQHDEDVATLEAAPSPSVNVREASVEGDSEDPGALNEVSSPLIEAKGPAEKGDTEAAQAPVEEVQEVAETTTTSEPDVDAASVDAAPAPVVKLDSEVAEAMTENVSPKTECVGLAEEGDCAPPEAPVEENNDVAEAITPIVPDEAAASLEAAPPPSVDVQERNVELNSNNAGTLNVDSSPQIGDDESVEPGGSAAADAPVEEVGEVAERTTIAEPVEVVTNSEAPPALDAGERSIELSNEDAGAVNEDVSPKCESEGSAEKDNSEAPDAPLEKVREFPEATVSAEREAVVASLDTDLSPSVDVGVNSVEVNSEGARALNEDISPTIEEGGSAKEDDSEARESPLEEVQVDALASSSVEADPDSASVKAAPSASVDPNCEDAGVVHEDFINKVGGEGLAEKVDSAAPEVPVEEAHEVAGAAQSAESEEDGASVDASPSPFVDVEESSLRALPEGAGDLIEDANPIIKDGGLVENSCSEAPAVPGEEVHDDAESVTSAAPNKDVADLEAVLSSSDDIGEEAVELDSEDARAVSADTSPVTKDGQSTEGGGSPAPEAPLDVDQEVPVASTSAEPDEVGAGLEAETLQGSVVSGGEPLDVDSEDAGAVCEDASLQVGDAGSDGTGEGEAPEAHIEEVQKVADAKTNAKPDEDAPSLEIANLPSAHLAETSVELKAEDSGAVSDDVSPVIKDEGWAEKGGCAATEAPADGKHEVAEAKSIDEPQEDSTSLEDAMSPSVVVQGRGVELDSENAEAVGAVVSPVAEGEGWTEKRNNAAPEAPLEVNQDAATEALSSTEPDEVGASMEAEPSPSDNVGAKPLEEDSAGAGPGTDVSLVVEDDGTGAKGDLEAAEAPVEDIHPVAENPSSCALDEDAASMKAATPPSFDVRVRDPELDSDHAGAVTEDVSPEVKDEGWAEKVDTAAPGVPGEVGQEVAESSTSAEPDEVVASLEASPSASARDSEKGIELDSDNVGAVSADVILAAEGEGSTKEGDSAAPDAPVDVNQEVPVAPTSAERDEVVSNLDAESSPSVDDRVNSGEVNSKDARALNEDIGPLIEEGESGAKDVSEAPEAPVDKVHDGPGATPSAEPEKEAASLDAAVSPAVDMEETSFKVNSEEDETLNENVSPKIKDRVATEKCESVAPNAPEGEVQEVAEATIRPQLDEVAASPEPAPSRSVHVGETSVGGLSEDGKAMIEDVSPVISDDESAEKGYSETLDLPVEEVHDVAEATPSAQPDEVEGSLEAWAPSSIEDQERSDRLDSEDAGAVNENVSPEREAKGSDDKSDNGIPSAPLEVVEEVEDASTRTEPDQHLANLNAVPSPSVDVGVKSIKLDSEGTRALNEDVGPRIEEKVSAEKGDADAAEAPLEEVHDVAAATSSVEADPDAAGLEATSSPSVDIGDKSVELNSEGARAETEDASLKTEGEGSAKEGDSTGTEAPAKEVNESAGVPPSVEPEEDAASLNAPPSHSDGLASVEADAEDAGTLNESGSPKIEDEGSATEKGESKEIVPPEEVNEVAEPKSTAEPLEAVSSPFANVEEKSFELDPDVARAASEDVSPEIEDEGSAEKGGSEAAEAPVEEVHEVAKAATSAEPLEASPPPLVDVEEKPLELGSEVAPALSVDASPEIEAEGSAAEKGESKASTPPDEVNEVAEPTSVAEPLEAAPSHFANVEEKPFELDPEVAPAVSEDVSPETEVEGSAAKDDCAVPVEEVHEPAEAPTNAEPDADVASLEAAPSRVADVGEDPLEVGSEAARGVSEDVSSETEDDVLAEKGDSTVPEEEVHEVTEVKTNAEPDDDVATVEAAPSRVADVKEKSFDLDPAVGGAESEEVSPETEGEGSAKKGDSEAPEAPAEEVREVAEAATSAEPDEDVATLDAAPSPIVDVKEKPLELDSKVAPALSVDASPEIEDEGSVAEKGESEASDPAEEVNEVAEPTSVAEPLEAAPSPFANVEEKPFELDPEVAPAGSEDVSPDIEDGESAEKGDSEVPEEEVHEVTEAATNAEPDADVASLKAAPSRVADVGEESLELGSEVARALSVDVSPKIEAEGPAAENGESEASAAPEKINEDTEPSSVADPLEVAPSSFADVKEKSFQLDPEVARPLSEDASPKIENAGLAEEGNRDAPEVPVEEANEVADAAAHVEPEETVASHEAVPSSSTELGEQAVDVDDKSFDLADKTVGIEDKSVDVSSGDVGAVSEELPVEVDASAEVSGTIADEESAETGGNEPAEAPVEEVHEVAEAATSAEPNEDVATLEAAPSSFVDAEEKPLELGSEVARALSVDASPETEAEGSAAEKGDSTIPEEEVHELKEATINAEPDEDVATLEATPSPAVSVEEKPLELGSEVSRALSVDASPKVEAEGLAADKDESEAPEAPVEEVNEVVEPITVAESLEAAALPFVDVGEKSLELDPEVAGAVSEDVSPETEDEGSAEKGDSAVPEDDFHEITEAATNSELDEDVATLEAAPSHVADVEEKSFELDPKVAGVMSEDGSPKIEDEGSAKKGDNEAPEAPADEVREVAEPIPVAEPLEAVPSPFVDVGEKSFELDPEVARAVSEDVSPESEDDGSAEKGDSAVPEEDVHELTKTTTNAQPDEDVAPLEAAPLSVADVGEESVKLDPENAVTAGEDVSPEFEDIGSADKGESDASEVPVEEANEVADPAAHVEPEETVASHEGVPASSTELGEQVVDVDDKSVDLADKAVGIEDKSVDVSSGDVGAVSEELPAEVDASEEVSPTIPDKESAETGGSEAAKAPVKEVHEVAEAPTSAEPDEDVATLEAAPSPFVDAEEKPLELGSEIARDLSVNASPETKEEGSAVKGDSETPDTPLEEVHEATEARNGAEADEGAGVEAILSPVAGVEEKSDDVEDKLVDVEDKPADVQEKSVDVVDSSVEMNSEDAGAVSKELPAEVAASEEVSPETPDEESAETGDIEAAEAPVQEVHEVAEAATSAEPDEDMATLETAPSPLVDAKEKPLELGSEIARALSVDVSPEIEAEGSGAENGESEGLAPPEEINDNTEPITVAEPLEAAPSPFADVEEKSFERDPEVGRPLSEDVSPKVADEGLATEKGDNETPEAPVEKANEVTEAATDIEPDEARANLETVPSSSAEVEDKFADADEKSVDTDKKAVALEPKPADVADRSGGTEDVAFAKEDLHAEDPANVEESPETLDQGSVEQGESEVHEAPVAEAAIDAEPDAPGASLEATPSPSVHARGTSAQPESEDAVAIGDDVSPQIEDGESGENSESEAPEARVEEVQEVAKATAGAEPAEDAARLDSVVSPSLDARERGIELDSEDLRAAASVDVSQNLEDEVLTDEGKSAAPEGFVEEARKIPDVPTSAEHDEVEASLDAEPSPSVHAGERDIELDSEEAGVVSDVVRPIIKDEELAREGDSAVPEAPVEVDQDVAKSSTGAEPDEVGASLDAKPLPCIDVGVTSIEPDSEETRALNEPLIEAGGSVEKGNSEAAEAPLEQIHEVAEASSSAEPDISGASLEAAISPSFGAIERGVELDSEDAGVASKDASSLCKDGESSKKGDSEAAGAHGEEVQENSVATPRAEPGDDAASEAAISPSVDVGDEGTADDGESNTLDVPAGGVGEVAEAAIHVVPDEGAAALEAVPSPSAEVEEKHVHEEENSVNAESKPSDIDYKPRDVLLDNSVGIDDKIVEVKSENVGVVRDESPAEVPATEDECPPFPNDGSTEKGYGGAPPAPREVANEVAEATTPVERNEAVASREAAAPYSVDVWERYFEQDSTEAGDWNEDLHSQIEDGGLAKKGDSVAAAEAPLEKLHEVADEPTSAKADEQATSVEAAPSPSLDIGAKSGLLGSEVADAVGENVSPVTKDEGTAEKVEPGDVADKSNEIAEVNSEILQAAPPHSVDNRGRSIELDSKDAGVLNEGNNRQIESSVSAEKGDNKGVAPKAPTEEVSEVITTSVSEPDDVVANLKAADVGEKSSEVRSEDAKAVSKDVSPHVEDEASRRPRKFRWRWWGLGTVVLSVFAASLFAFFSGQTGGLAVPFQVLPFLP